MFLQLFVFNLKQKYKSSIYGLLFEVRMQFSPDKQGVFLFVWWVFFKNLFPVQILGFFFFNIFTVQGGRRDLPVYIVLTLTAMVFAFCFVHHLAICILLRLFFMKLLEITNFL